MSPPVRAGQRFCLARLRFIRSIATAASARRWCAAPSRARGLPAISVILLVGDAPYYSRFGFSAAQTGELWMPGRFERDRLLALELKPAALAGARGMIGAAGQLEPKPDLNALIAANGGARHAVVQRAA